MNRKRALLESKRLESIRRNKKLLDGLDLPAALKTEQAALVATPTSAPGRSRKRRRAGIRSEASSAVEDIPLRRSSRLTGGAGGTLESLPENWPDEDGGHVVRVRSKSARSSAKPAAPRELPADSSRNLKCDTDLIASQVGHPAPAFGKVSVMDLYSASMRPRFSKMSGITEWSNAIFLWVNIGGPEGYQNAFKSRDEELHITWFAGSRHTVDTPAISRLLQHVPGDDPAARSTGDHAAVAAPLRFLFCRLPGEPYVCCGQLLLRSFDPESSPLTFTWALKDACGMEKSSHLKSILAAGSAKRK